MFDNNQNKQILRCCLKNMKLCTWFQKILNKTRCKTIFIKLFYDETGLSHDYLNITWLYYVMTDDISVLVEDDLGKKVKSGRGMFPNVPTTANHRWQAEGFCFPNSRDDFESIKRKLFSSLSKGDFKYKIKYVVTSTYKRKRRVLSPAKQCQHSLIEHSGNS